MSPEPISLKGLKFQPNRCPKCEAYMVSTLGSDFYWCINPKCGHKEDKPMIIQGQDAEGNYVEEKV